MDYALASSSQDLHPILRLNLSNIVYNIPYNSVELSKFGQLHGWAQLKHAIVEIIDQLIIKCIIDIVSSSWLTGGEPYGLFKIQSI